MHFSSRTGNEYTLADAPSRFPCKTLVIISDRGRKKKHKKEKKEKLSILKVKKKACRYVELNMCQGASDWTLGEGGWSQEQAPQGSDHGTKSARVQGVFEQFKHVVWFSGLSCAGPRSWTPHGSIPTRNIL